MNARSRMVVGAAVTVAAVLAAMTFVAVAAPESASARHDDDTTTTTDATTTSPTTSPTTSTTAPLGGPGTTTTTELAPQTPRVAGVELEKPFLDVPSSPATPNLEIAPPVEQPVDAPAPTTTTAPPSTAPRKAAPTPGCGFQRSRRRIVVTGIVLPAPEPVLGAKGAFARAYGMTCGLAGVVSVHGTLTIDYTTNTFAQLSGRGLFVGSLRSVGGVELTFLTTVPRSTSFAGTETAVESGRVTGVKGWRGSISLRYTATDTGDRQGSYRAVFTRTTR